MGLVFSGARVPCGLVSYYLLYVLLGLAAFLGRRPLMWLGGVSRTFGRVRALRAQVETNPANTIARRDLARVYLDRARPGKAIELLDEALERFPNDAELLYLSAVARLRSGDAEGALSPIIRAVDIDPRVGFGEAYVVAGDALRRLGRDEEAVDAYERFVDANSSSIRGLCKLALAQRAIKDEAASKQALREAHRTWGHLPGFLRRKQFWWFLASHLLRAII